ncbi:MAG: ABC transporter permease [Candidatus Zixiibacteriota bacterium]|nr:MAG: ABC transporter permease [candidate division Zixibacteria bacterium]
MLKSYLRVALRNLYKNKLYSVINIVGLGVAMAMCVAGYINYQFGHSYNNFQENLDDIYMVSGYQISDNERQDWSFIPLPMGSAVAEDVPGIERLTRMSGGGATVRYEDAVFSENYHLAEPAFFEMFTFPVTAGAADPLRTSTGIVITERIAQKYFGREDPIGRTLTFNPDGGRQFDFTVESVVANPPMNSSLQFRFILPLAWIEELRSLGLNNWEHWARATFVQVSENTSPTGIEGQLQSYVQSTNAANENFQMDGFSLIPMRQLASVSRELRGQFFPSMHPTAMLAPSITALLVLLLACFNFINTAVAYASRRLKEIGIRKVVGGARSQLIKQFLGENLVLCFLALVVAAFLAEVFVPAYDSLWPEISLSMDYSENLGLVGFLVGLLLFTGLAAGAYPAFYVSRFHPVDILKGQQKLSGTSPLIRVLLTFQLALSITAVIAAVILTRNADYISDLDLGFDRHNVFVAPVNGETEYTALRAALEGQPGVRAIGGSNSLMGRMWSAADIESGEIKERLRLFQIGEDFVETFGLQITQGRSFDPQLASDFDEAVIVNQTLVSEFGWTDPVGKHIKFITSDTEQVECRVIGVVNDFYPNGVWTRVRPTTMRLARPDDYYFLIARYDNDNRTAFASSIEDTWKRLFPHRPYNGFWHSETLEEEAQVNNSIRLVFLYIAVMVVIISAMGLFAIVSLNITRRTKEIGIRKILGASVRGISFLVVREFVLLILIGIVLASGLTYFLVDSLMASIFEYYCDFGIAPFVFGGLLVLVVALVTASYQVYSAATANPVEALRYE